MIFYTDYSLEGSNTFNIKAKANVFYEVGLREDLDSFVRKRKLMDMPRLVLGNGSNVLFVKKCLNCSLKFSGKQLVILPYIACHMVECI